MTRPENQPESPHSGEASPTPDQPATDHRLHADSRQDDFRSTGPPGNRSRDGGTSSTDAPSLLETVFEDDVAADGGGDDPFGTTLQVPSVPIDAESLEQTPDERPPASNQSSPSADEPVPAADDPGQTVCADRNEADRDPYGTTDHVALVRVDDSTIASVRADWRFADRMAATEFKLVDSEPSTEPPFPPASDNTANEQTFIEQTSVEHTVCEPEASACMDATLIRSRSEQAGFDSAGSDADSLGSRTTPVRTVVPKTLGSQETVTPEQLQSALTAGFPQFEILDTLGQGGMGVVFKARDRKQGHEVALKTLLRRDAVALNRFKGEFRVLADIAHPNIASLYDLISDGEFWFFTMELIDGLDSDRYILTATVSNQGQPLTDQDLARTNPAASDSPSSRAPRPLEAAQIRRLRNVFVQVVRGLTALHRAGLIHRDIKPSNVMVTRTGQVRLVDFGLAAGLESSSTGTFRTRLEGTIPYVSPEQAAGRSASDRSDWYAVGVLLFEMLTGVWPFRGTRDEILEAKQNQDAPLASALVRGVPSDLDAICRDLLARDPDARPTGEQLLERLGDAGASGFTSRANAAASAADCFVGREEPRQQLHAAFESLSAEVASCFVVTGLSGFGKSQLVRQFLQEISEDSHSRPIHERATVISGRCYERESVPYKAWDSLIDSLASHLLQSVSTSEALSLLPRRVAPLLQVFPALRRVPALNVAAEGEQIPTDVHELRQQAIGALREMLARLGDCHPLVLSIDDVQWGDDESAMLLVELLKHPDPPAVLLIATHRGAGNSRSPFLRAVDHWVREVGEPPEIQFIDVGPFDHRESIELAIRLFGRDDETTRVHADRIASEAGGNPFFIQELVRASLQLLDQQGMDADDATDGLDAADFDAETVLTEQLSLDEVLWRRACTLPASAQKLLHVIACTGSPIDEPLAYRAADILQDGPIMARLLRTELLVRAEEGDRVVCYHDRIRESVSDHLTERQTRNIHLRIAETIETRGDESSVSRVFDLAFHFDAAGESGRAVPYALAAGRQAEAQYSLEVAEDQYRIAQRGADSVTRDVRFEIAQGLGRVAMLRGRYAVAEAAFQQARELAETDFVRATIDSSLGELAFKRGDLATAARVLETAVRSLGRYVPGNVVTTLLAAGRELVVQGFHTVLPGLFVGRRPLPDSDTKSAESRRSPLAAGASPEAASPGAASISDIDFLVMRLFSRMAYTYWFFKGQVPCLWAHLHEMNLAEKYPPTLERAQAYSEHAPVMSTLPLHRRGADYAQQSYEIRRELGHLWGTAQSMNFKSLVLYSATRLAAAEEALHEAIETFEKTGDWWEMNLGRYQLGLVWYRQGRLKEAAEISERVHRSGLELGDSQASGISLHTWAMAVDGDIPEQTLLTELARPRHDFQVVAQVLLARGIQLLHAGQPIDAVEVLQQARRVVGKHGLRSTYIAPIFPWLVTALRFAWQATPERDVVRRRSLLKQMTRACRSASMLTWFYRLDHPHTLREAGEIALLKQRPARAIRLFERSIAESQRIGSPFETARTNLRLYQTRHTQGTASDADVAAARQELARRQHQADPRL